MTNIKEMKRNLRQFIGLSDIKKTFMTSPIKIITSVLKALTDIITNNPALNSFITIVASPLL
jgi:hypothetical protein